MGGINEDSWPEYLRLIYVKVFDLYSKVLGIFTVRKIELTTRSRYTAKKVTSDHDTNNSNVLVSGIMTKIELFLRIRNDLGLVVLNYNTFSIGIVSGD